MMEENIELVFSRNPYNQMGGYLKRCLGLEMYFKIENPPGARIQKIFVNGRPLDPSGPTVPFMSHPRGSPPGMVRTMRRRI